MARVPMVTRTLTTTDVVVKCVNIEEESIFEQTVPLAGTYKSNEKLFKEIEKVFAGSPVKPITIVSTEERETLYGMKETDFIKNAVVLPPRSAKE